MAEVESFRAYWDRVGWKGNWFAVDDRVTGFYVAMLARAARYDRMAGYFTSSALSLAAAGLSRFVAGGGVMRIIVGSQLDEEDIAAIERGQPLDEAVRHRLLDSDAFDDPTDPVAEHRRQVLGWMVKAGRLQIRVGVPVDPTTGRPLRPQEASSYFHSKYGIFVDHVDPPNQVAFIGSDNETWKGWVGNHETFSTFPTWIVPVWNNNGVTLVAAFDAHWHDRPDEGWVVLDLDEAVREELVSWCHGDTPPAERDPEETPGITAEPAGPGAVDPRLVELAEAPRRDGGTFVGLVTASVKALPHQDVLVRRVVESWPRGYLLADEVGLGKTIEGGFIIRELLLSGKAERFLLLVPASVLRQWQEELAEKLNLRANRYEDGEFYDPAGNPVPFRGPLWSAFPIVLASSHLARRRDRRPEVLSAGAVGPRPARRGAPRTPQGQGAQRHAERHAAARRRDRQPQAVQDPDPRLGDADADVPPRGLGPGTALRYSWGVGGLCGLLHPLLRAAPTRLPRAGLVVPLTHGCRQRQGRRCTVGLGRRDCGGRARLRRRLPRPPSSYPGPHFGTGEGSFS
jgi:hypothetical protein